MLKSRDRTILLGIVQYSERILSKIRNVCLRDFEENEDLKEIICFNLLQIGELAKHLSDDFLLSFYQVPWKQIKGLRDHVAHGYGTLDLELIYNTARSEIPELKEYCEEILSRN